MEPEEPSERGPGCSAMEQDDEPSEKQTNIKQEVAQSPSHPSSNQTHYPAPSSQDSHRSQQKQHSAPPPQQSQASQQPPPESKFLLKPAGTGCKESQFYSLPFEQGCS